MATGFNPRKDVNVLLLYKPIENLGKHLLDKQFPEKAALLNASRARNATCMAKKKGPEFKWAYVIIPAKNIAHLYRGGIDTDPWFGE